MAGLNLLNFVDGAMKGASFVAGMQDRQQRSGLMQLQEQRAQESHGKEMEVRDMQIKKAGMDMEEEAKKRIARTMRAAERNGVPLSQIPMSDDDKAFFEKFGLTASPQYFMAEKSLKATSTLDKVMSGELALNHPDAHEALEVLVPDIQSRTKADGEVRVNGIYPSKDGKGINIGLHLKRKDGTEDPNAVVTVGRTSDPKDPVRTLELGPLLGRGAAMGEFQRIASDQRLARVFMDAYAPEDQLQNLKALKYKADIAKSLRGGDKVTWGPIETDKETGAKFQRSSSGEIKWQPKGSGGAGGGDRKSALELEVEYLKTLGMTPEEALAYKKQQTGNEARDVQLLAATFAERESIPMDDYKDEKNPDVTLPGAITKAINARDKINRLVSGREKQPKPEAAPKPAPQKTQKIGNYDVEWHN